MDSGSELAGVQTTEEESAVASSVASAAFAEVSQEADQEAVRWL